MDRATVLVILGGLVLCGPAAWILLALLAASGPGAMAAVDCFRWYALGVMTVPLGFGLMAAGVRSAEYKGGP